MSAKVHAVYLRGLPDEEPLDEMRKAVKTLCKSAGRIKKIKVIAMVSDPTSSRGDAIVVFQKSGEVSKALRTLQGIREGIEVLRIDHADAKAAIASAPGVPLQLLQPKATTTATTAASTQPTKASGATAETAQVQPEAPPTSPVSNTVAFHALFADPHPMIRKDGVSQTATPADWLDRIGAFGDISGSKLDTATGTLLVRFADEESATSCLEFLHGKSVFGKTIVGDFVRSGFAVPPVSTVSTDAVLLNVFDPQRARLVRSVPRDEASAAKDAQQNQQNKTFLSQLEFDFYHQATGCVSAPVLDVVAGVVTSSSAIRVTFVSGLSSIEYKRFWHGKPFEGRQVTVAPTHAAPFVSYDASLKEQQAAAVLAEKEAAKSAAVVREVEAQKQAAAPAPAKPNIAVDVSTAAAPTNAGAAFSKDTAAARETAQSPRGQAAAPAVASPGGSGPSPRALSGSAAAKAAALEAAANIAKAMAAANKPALDPLGILTSSRLSGKSSRRSSGDKSRDSSKSSKKHKRRSSGGGDKRSKKSRRHKSRSRSRSYERSHSRDRRRRSRDRDRDRGRRSRHR